MRLNHFSLPIPPSIPCFPSTSALSAIYIYIVDWRRSSRRVERKLIKIHIAHINEAESIFIAVRLDGFSRGTIQSPCLRVGIWVKGRWNSYFRSITLTFWQTLIASAPCVQRGLSLVKLEFDLLIHLSLFRSHHLCPFDEGESILSDSGSR